MAIDGQIQATRQASSAFDGIGDVEVARRAAESSLAQFEGMHALSPENADALFLLTKGWGGYGAGFVMDDVERAQDAGDETQEKHHRERARMAFDRGVTYGLALLAQKAGGFGDAKKSAAGLERWLAKNFASKDDAPGLLWTGVAWLSRVQVMMGDEDEGPGFIAEMYVGVALVERAVALDRAVEHYTGVVALASYHARNAMAEPEVAKKLLDAAMSEAHGAVGMIPLAYATTYACVKGDTAVYRAMLDRAISATDKDPSDRLENALAKQRARRWLAPRRAKDACGMDLGRGPSAALGPP
jgi:hypothetical protein